MPLPLLIAAAAAGAKTGAGFINKRKAKKEAARLAATRPKATASPYLQEQLDLAKSELATGVSAETDRAYNEATDRDLSTSIGAILKGGGSVNNISDIFDNSQQGRQRYALMRENLRLNQINNLFKAYSDSDRERDKLFEFNEWRPWADASQANAAARQGAESQIWSGIDTLAGSVAGMFGPKPPTDGAGVGNAVKAASSTGGAASSLTTGMSTIPQYGFEDFTDFSRVEDYIPYTQVQ